MGWLVFALGIAIPATIPAGHFGGLPVQYGLTFIWAAFALAVALALVGTAQQNRRLPRHGSASAPTPRLARA